MFENWDLQISLKKWKITQIIRSLEVLLFRCFAHTFIYTYTQYCTLYMFMCVCVIHMKLHIACRQRFIHIIYHNITNAKRPYDNTHLHQSPQAQASYLPYCNSRTTSLHITLGAKDPKRLQCGDFAEQFKFCAGQLQTTVNLL